MTRSRPAAIAITVLALGAVTSSTPRPLAETAMTPGGVTIPASIRAEHEAIHTALVEATKSPGPVGAAASALVKVLHPHFVREEEIALPPLGLLAPLAADAVITPERIAEVLAMTEALRRELPRMLEEHKAIRAAVARLRDAATAAGDKDRQQLADQLALHAQTEEEILYPAAVLVGDLIQRRTR
jgi:hypothetical protein